MSRKVYFASLLPVVLVLAGCGGKSNSPIPIAKTLSSLSMSVTSVSLSVGAAQQLTVMGHFSDGSQTDLTTAAQWATSNPAVTTVRGGLLTGIASGSATVTASLGNLNSAVAVVVTSLPPPPRTLASLTLNPASELLSAGASQQLALIGNYSDGSQADVTSSASWGTSNPAVATVNGGLLTGMASGNVTVTATLATLSATATVTVDPAHEVLFASDSTNNVIGAWQINVNTGALTPVSGSPFPVAGGQAQGMVVHPSGKFLYLVNQVTPSDPGGITAFSIAADGTLRPVGSETPDTQQGGGGLRAVIDPAGAHVYVASFVSIGAASFTIDPVTGALSQLDPQPFDFQDRHWTKDLAIVNGAIFLTSAGGIDGNTINSDGSAASSTTISRSSTTVPLERLAVSGRTLLYATTSPTPLPGDPNPPDSGHIYGWAVNGDGTLTQITSNPVALSGVQAIVASSSLLFASSPAGITVYAVDSNSGELTEITGSPFPGGNQLGDLNVDPSTKFLYAVNGRQIVAFAIGRGGSLSRVPGSPFSTGNLQPFALASTPF